MSKTCESHKQVMSQLVDRFVGDIRGPAFKEKLVEEILCINDRWLEEERS